MPTESTRSSPRREIFVGFAVVVGREARSLNQELFDLSVSLTPAYKTRKDLPMRSAKQITLSQRRRPLPGKVRRNWVVIRQ